MTPRPTRRLLPRAAVLALPLLLGACGAAELFDPADRAPGPIGLIDPRTRLPIPGQAVVADTAAAPVEGPQAP